MKKLFFFLLLLLLTSKTMFAQTYEEVKERVKNERLLIAQELEQINNRLYYLEVELPKLITEDSLRSLSGKKYLLKPSRLKGLKQDRLFAAEEVAKLENRKKGLLDTDELLSAKELEIKEFRVTSDIKSNLPERMTSLEFKQRTRTQFFKASESLSDSLALKKFPGLLVNYKTGKNEIATFSIYRVGFPEFPASIYTLKPGEKYFTELPLGNYTVQVSCGSYLKEFPFSVDYRAKKYFDGNSVYFAAYKAMSDN